MNCRFTIWLIVAAATVSLTAQTRAIAITGASIVDVVNGRLLRNSTVTINGPTIVSIASKGAPAAGAIVVDGRGKFVIPGLWDMHAHVGGTPEWLPLYVANGVTGIRDMGANLDSILKLREATASGTLLGPRIVAAGPILDNPPGDWPFRMRVRTADEGRSAVRMLKGRGVDLIKVHDHTPHDAFFAIAEEARRQKLPVAGHVPIGLTVEQVIDAGQGDIEHLSNLQMWRPCSGGDEYRPEPCRPFFEMLARRGIWQTPTLAAASELTTIGTPASAISADQLVYASKRLRGFWAENRRLFVTGPEMVRRFKAAAQTGAVVTKDMANAGVGVLAGCDMMVAGFCVHDELEFMVRGGMTSATALRTATINPARYFGLQGTVGTVAAGQRADLVVLDANPLTDISNIRQIRAVVVAGRLLDRSDLDKTLADVRRAVGARQ